jgi:hypothetical protein
MKHFGAWSDLPADFDQISKNFRKTINEDIEKRLEEALDDISR